MRGRSTKCGFKSQTDGKSKSLSKNHLKCYYCGKGGHTKKKKSLV